MLPELASRVTSLIPDDIVIALHEEVFDALQITLLERSTKVVAAYVDQLSGAGPVVPWLPWGPGTVLSLPGGPVNPVGPPLA